VSGYGTMVHTSKPSGDECEPPSLAFTNTFRSQLNVIPFELFQVGVLRRNGSS
jgi:hypothetical protein